MNPAGRDWKAIDWANHVGPGWKRIVQPLVDYCINHNIQIAQVKEKFGGLRFYTDGGDEVLHEMVGHAEAQSFGTCEECGEPGSRHSTREHPWMKTLCDHHKETRK